MTLNNDDFMSKVYNECCFKRDQSMSCLFLWIWIINYAQLYKSSHTVFYDIVSTCRLVVLKLFNNLRSGIKLRTLNITKI